MKTTKRCGICGDLISIEGNTGDPPKGHLCGICYRFICDKCIDWEASGRGFRNVCKICTSNSVILDLDKFTIPEEPVFLTKDGTTTSLDEAQQYTAEEVELQNLPEELVPIEVKEAIILLQALHETLKTYEADDLDSLLSLNSIPHQRNVRRILGNIELTCLCGNIFSTQFCWEKNERGFMEVNDPCPACGRKLFLNFHVRFQ